MLSAWLYYHLCWTPGGLLRQPHCLYSVARTEPKSKLKGSKTSNVHLSLRWRHRILVPTCALILECQRYFTIKYLPWQHHYHQTSCLAWNHAIAAIMPIHSLPVLQQDDVLTFFRLQTPIHLSRTPTSLAHTGRSMYSVTMYGRGQSVLKNLKMVGDGPDGGGVRRSGLEWE